VRASLGHRLGANFIAPESLWMARNRSFRPSRLFRGSSPKPRKEREFPAAVARASGWTVKSGKLPNSFRCLVRRYQGEHRVRHCRGGWDCWALSQALFVPPQGMPAAQRKRSLEPSVSSGVPFNPHSQQRTQWNSCSDSERAIPEVRLLGRACRRWTAAPTISNAAEGPVRKADAADACE
jgi:hypothetical protein